MSYLGVTADELGADLDIVVGQLVTQLFEPDSPLIQDMGPMVIARSPVLVILDGEVRQPAALLPRSMLSRFWTAPGADAIEDPNLVALVAGYARALASDDELAKAALSDTEDIYVDQGAPTMPWPDQDPRLRLASLVLADVVRKLAADLTPSDIKGSYGLTDAPAAAAMRVATMKNEEAAWFMAALTSADT